MARERTSQQVEVESRETIGKNANRRLRAVGRVPGIVYGLTRPPFMVSVSPKRIEEVLHLESGQNTLFKLILGDSQRDAMIRELQRDPVTDRILHVDFVRVDPTRIVQVSVPIRLLGIAIGVRLEDGIVDFVHREVRIECLPGAIPEHLDVDISELHVNQHVAIADLKVPDGVKLLEPAESIVAVVAAPKAEEAAAPVAEAPTAAAEPAVIKKGKETEGDEKDK